MLDGFQVKQKSFLYLYYWNIQHYIWDFFYFFFFTVIEGKIQLMKGNRKICRLTESTDLIASISNVLTNLSSMHESYRNKSNNL